MKTRDRVWLKDPMGEHFGTVTTLNEHSGMCTVKWDSGMTERIHRNELTVLHKEGDVSAMLRTEMPNQVTVSDWLGTAMTAAQGAVRKLDDLREQRVPAPEAVLLDAYDDLRQAVEEIEAVVDQLHIKTSDRSVARG